MLTLEEYIIRRKREDQINEFDKDARMENLQKCVSYVFEYFNNYLDITKMEERTSLNIERLGKYRGSCTDMNQKYKNGWLTFMKSMINN